MNRQEQAIGLFKDAKINNPVLNKKDGQEICDAIIDLLETGWTPNKILHFIYLNRTTDKADMMKETAQVIIDNC